MRTDLLQQNKEKRGIAEFLLQSVSSSQTVYQCCRLSAVMFPVAKPSRWLHQKAVPSINAFICTGMQSPGCLQARFDRTQLSPRSSRQRSHGLPFLSYKGALLGGIGC